MASIEAPNSEPGPDGAIPEVANAAPEEGGDSTLPLYTVAVLQQDYVYAYEVLRQPLISRCMSDLGFVYDVPDLKPPKVTPSDIFLRQRYGTPYEMNGVWGYAFSSPNADDRPLAEIKQSDAYLEALFGDTVREETVTGPDGSPIVSSSLYEGCAGDAAVDIFGSADAYFDALRQLALAESALATSLFELRSLTALWAPWVACMANLGYEFTNALEPGGGDWDFPRPTEVEQQVAKADADCRQTTSLSDQDIVRREAELQSEAVEAFGVDIASLNDLVKGMISRAAT